MSKTENSATNIVLIVTDQQRWDTLGCLGYAHVITPHIDRLAARGVAFSRATEGRGCSGERNTLLCYYTEHIAESFDKYDFIEQIALH